MRNYLLSGLILLILSGCSSNNSFSGNNEMNAESLMIHSKNYQGLITLYKTELQQQESVEIRKKLVQLYLDRQDPESAKFYLQPLLIEAQEDAEVQYLSGYAYYALGKKKESILALELALTLQPKLAKAQNLLGVIYASDAQFTKADALFTQARHNLYDEEKVRNNLAVINIIHQDYTGAISKLMPLYRNGISNEQVISNLLLALAKAGEIEQVQYLLKDKYSRDEIMQRYHSLRTLPLNSEVTQESVFLSQEGSDEK